MKKVIKTDLATLFISLGALVLAALALNKSLNKLAGKEQE